MSQTNTLPTVNHEPLMRIMERIAMPLFLFAAVLFGLLMLSWMLLLPRFTHIEVNGSLLSPSEVIEFEEELKSELGTLEATRNQLVLPVRDETYLHLREEKRGDRSLLMVQDQIERIARDVAEGEDRIVIESLSIDLTERKVSLTGDVRNVGPRSMTLLASFIEAVGEASFVSDLEPSAFTRVDDGKGNFHSPFSFSFTVSSDL